jgi:hypothetical protein
MGVVESPRFFSFHRFLLPGYPLKKGGFSKLPFIFAKKTTFLEALWP